jgi:hypothetical protein
MPEYETGNQDAADWTQTDSQYTDIAYEIPQAEN